MAAPTPILFQDGAALSGDTGGAPLAPQPKPLIETVFEPAGRNLENILSDLDDLIHELREGDPMVANYGRPGSRDLALAVTHLEDAQDRIKRHIEKDGVLIP